MTAVAVFPLDVPARLLGFEQEHLEIYGLSMMNRLSRPCVYLLIFGCELGWLVPFADAGRPTVQRYEPFDVDPGWKGVNNRVRDPDPPMVRQNFGWSQSDHASGGTGEIGGVVWRSVRPAYYAKVLPELSINDHLECSGSVALMHFTAADQYHTGSAIWVGFFNAAKQGWRPLNHLGFRLLGHRDYQFADYKSVLPGALVELHCGTSAYSSMGQFIKHSGSTRAVLMKKMVQDEYVRVPADGRRHAWKLELRPKRNDTPPEIFFQWDDCPPTVLKVGARTLKSGAFFNRFGIFNEPLPGFSMTAWFDEITINGTLHDFSTDPGWEAKGNRDAFVDHVQYGTNDFGYSQTHHAGGQRSGELGGRLWEVGMHQTHIRAHCGDSVGRLSLDERLVAQGKIAIPQFGTDSGIFIGWFDAAEQGSPPRNFAGVLLNTLSSTGRFIAPQVVGSNGRHAFGDVQVLFTPDGRVYDWTLDYDPLGAQGRGTLRLSLGDQVQMIELPDGMRQEGAIMNRFGMFNMQDNNGKFCEVYLDDLEYTVERK